MLAGKVYIGEARVDKAGRDARRRRAVECAARTIRTSRAAALSSRARSTRSALDPRGAIASTSAPRPAASPMPPPARRGAGLRGRRRLRPARAEAAPRPARGRARAHQRARRSARAIGRACRLGRVDASFICLAQARCPRSPPMLAPGGALVALVKPQFEVGREEASKGRGVIRDPLVARGRSKRRRRRRGRGLRDPRHVEAHRRPEGQPRGLRLRPEALELGWRQRCAEASPRT